jgi:hypothetical protein
MSVGAIWMIGKTGEEYYRPTDEEEHNSTKHRGELAWIPHRVSDRNDLWEIPDVTKLDTT